MTCSKCGTRFADGLKFCPSCGAIVEGATGNGGPKASSKPGRIKVGRSISPKIWLYLGGLALIVLVGVGIWAFLNPVESPLPSAAQPSITVDRDQPPADNTEKRPARRRRTSHSSINDGMSYLYLQRHPKLPIFGTFEFQPDPPKRPREVAQWVRDGLGVVVRGGMPAYRIEERDGFVLVQIADGKHVGSEVWVNNHAFQNRPPPGQ